MKVQQNGHSETPPEIRGASVATHEPLVSPGVEQLLLDPAMAAYDPEALDAKQRNIIYHDWEATQYDDKRSISFDERCISYAKEKFVKVAPIEKYGKVLEVGCGTGFFIVNLWQAGLVRQAFATDISEGMVRGCKRHARTAGL